MSGDPKPGGDGEKDEQSKNSADEKPARDFLNNSQVKIQNIVLEEIERLRRKVQNEKGVDIDVVKDILTPWKEGEPSYWDDAKEIKRIDSRVLDDLIEDYPALDAEANKWSAAMGENIKNAIQKLHINPSAAALLSYTTLIEKPKSTGLVQLTFKRIIQDLTDSTLQTDLGASGAEEARNALTLEPTPPPPGGMPEADWKQVVSGIYSEMLKFLETGSAGPEEIYGYSAESYVENASAKLAVAKEVLFSENELRSETRARIVRGIFSEEWDKITAAAKPEPVKPAPTEPGPAAGAAASASGSPDASKGARKIESVEYITFKPLWRLNDDEPIFIKSQIKDRKEITYPSPCPIPDSLKGKKRDDAAVVDFLKDLAPYLKEVHDTSRYPLGRPAAGDKKIDVICTENPFQQREVVTVALNDAIPNWLVQLLGQGPDVISAMLKSDNEMEAYRATERDIFLKALRNEAKRYRLHQLFKEEDALKKYTVAEYQPTEIAVPDDFSPPEDAASTKLSSGSPSTKTPPKVEPAAAAAGAPTGTGSGERPPRDTGPRPERSKFDNLPKELRALFRNDDVIKDFDFPLKPRRNKAGELKPNSELQTGKTSALTRKIVQRLWDTLEQITKAQFALIAGKKDIDLNKLMFLKSLWLDLEMSAQDALDESDEKIYEDALGGKEWEDDDLKDFINAMTTDLWKGVAKKIAGEKDPEIVLNSVGGLLTELDMFYARNFEKPKDDATRKGKKADEKKPGEAKPGEATPAAEAKKEGGPTKESTADKYAYLTAGEKVLIQKGEGATTTVEELSFRGVSDDGKTVILEKEVTPGNFRRAPVPEKPFGLLNRPLKDGQRVLWPNSEGELSEDWELIDVDQTKKTATLMGIKSNTGESIPNTSFVQIRKRFPKVDLEAKPKRRIFNPETNQWETDWVAAAGLCKPDPETTGKTEQDYIRLEKTNEYDWEIPEARLAKWNQPQWAKAPIREDMDAFEASITEPNDKAQIEKFHQWLAAGKIPAGKELEFRKRVHALIQEAQQKRSRGRT